MKELRAQFVVKGQEEVDAAVQTIPPTTETTPTEATPTAVILQTRSVYIKYMYHRTGFD